MLMFGTEMRLPVDVVFGLPERLVIASPSSYVAMLADRMRRIYEVARNTDDAAHVLQKDYYDESATNAKFPVNTAVWLLDTVIPTGLGQRKFHKPWKGPYYVVTEKHPVYSIRSAATQREQRVHFNRLKKCRSAVPAPIPPEPPPPANTGPSLTVVDDDADNNVAAPHPRAHLRRNAGLPVRLQQFHVPPPGHR